MNLIALILAIILIRSCSAGGICYRTPDTKNGRKCYKISFPDEAEKNKEVNNEFKENK